MQNHIYKSQEFVLTEQNHSIASTRPRGADQLPSNSVQFLLHIQAPRLTSVFGKKVALNSTDNLLLSKGFHISHWHKELLDLVPRV